MNENPFDFNVEEFLKGMAMKKLVKKYPNFEKYPASIQEGITACENAIEKCTDILKKQNI